MRITRHDIPPKTGTAASRTRETVNSPKADHTPARPSGAETLPAKLGRILAGHGIKVTQSQLVMLESGLAGLGILPEMLDGTTTLHALLLSRHNIPLSRALLIPGGEQPQSVLTGIVSLYADVKAMLATEQVTGGTRAAMEWFVRSVAGLFRFDEAADPSLADPARVSSMVMKNGLSFEWRLLAWYRAGHDPQLLRILVDDDLKGVLIDFLNRLRKRGGGKRAAGKNLEKLEQSVESALKTMTNRQITDILDMHVGRRSIAFEIPLGGRPGEGHAVITAQEKEENSGSESPAPGEYTLSFEVETTHLGMVTAFMTVAGNAVSLRFELDDGSVVLLGEDMGDEIREGLRKQGFAVGDIEFEKRAVETQSRKRRSKPSSNLDITG